MEKKRCNWYNINNNQEYLDYHDNEWCIENHDDSYLFELLILELFHCGLSFNLIIKKREAFRDAFDNFDYHKIANYDESKIIELMNNKNIVRNKLKILSTINNAKCFIKVQKEFGSFDQYIWSFTNNKVVVSKDDALITSNELSDKVSEDLKKRGFKFLKTVTVFSYLESIGVMNNHKSYCFKKNEVNYE